MCFVREPIWTFILYKAVVVHLPVVADVMSGVAIAAACLIICTLFYLDYMWSSYHVGELRGRDPTGIETN